MRYPQGSLVIAGILLLCWGGMVRTVTAGDVEYDVIRRELREWQASIVSLRIVRETRSLPEDVPAVVEWDAAPEPESARLFQREEWIWARQGLELLDQRSFYWQADATGVRSLDVLNGPEKFEFRATYRQLPSGTEEFTELALSDLEASKLISWKSRTSFDGLYRPPAAGLLAELHSGWDWQIDGIEDVLGERCARLRATRPEEIDAEFRDLLWLDLNRSCLVRRYLRPRIPRRRAGSDFIVDEFQQVDGIWLPKRGRLQMYAGPEKCDLHQLFVITEAQVNQTLELHRFDPPTPEAGTIVKDARRPNRPPAEPAAMNWKWWVRLAIGVSMFCVGLTVWYGKRRAVRSDRGG